MILIDTNVVIDYLRSSDPKLLRDLPTLPVAVCGVTRAEILGGQRSAKQRSREVAVLDSFIQLPIQDVVWDQVGDHLAALRAGGVTVPFQDVVIATVAITSGIELWTRDQHFGLVRSLVPALRLFAEPP
jgi:predicted nucleic acid-binding protein